MAWDAVGPFYAYQGTSPTTAAGAGMTQLRKVRQVSFDLNQRTAWTSTDAQGGIPFADGIYTLAVNAQAQIGLMDFDIDQAALLALGSQSNTNGSQTSVGFPTAFAAVAESSVPYGALIPSGEGADKEDAEHGIWFSAFSPQGPSGMTFGRINEGEIDQSYNVTWNAGYRVTDSDSTTISPNWRSVFMGPPAAAPTALAWSLADPV